MSHTDSSDSDVKLEEIRKRIEQRKKDLQDLEDQEKAEHERRARRAEERARQAATTTSPTKPTATAIPAPSSTPTTTAPTITTTTPAGNPPAGPQLSEEEKKRLAEEKWEIEEATRIRREVRARSQREAAERKKMIEEQRQVEDKRRVSRIEEERMERDQREHDMMERREREKEHEIPDKEHWEKVQLNFDEREKKEKEAAAKQTGVFEPEWYKSDFAWFCEDDKPIVLEQHPHLKYALLGERLKSDWLHLPASMKHMYEEKAQRDFSRYSEQRKRYDEKAGLGPRPMQRK